jgi:hypothetical protein
MRLTEEISETLNSFRIKTSKAVQESIVPSCSSSREIIYGVNNLSSWLRIPGWMDKYPGSVITPKSEYRPPAPLPG